MAESLGGGVPKLFEKGLPRVMAVAEVSSKIGTEYKIRDLRNIIYETATSLKDTRKFFVDFSTIGSPVIRRIT